MICPHTNYDKEDATKHGFRTKCLDCGTLIDVHPEDAGFVAASDTKSTSVKNTIKSLLGGA